MVQEDQDRLESAIEGEEERNKSSNTDEELLLTPPMTVPGCPGRPFGANGSKVMVKLMMVTIMYSTCTYLRTFHKKYIPPDRVVYNHLLAFEHSIVSYLQPTQNNLPHKTIVTKIIMET